MPNDIKYEILREDYFKFYKISKKMQKRIFTLLNYCKEIRDTAYPMKDSSVTELEIVEFSARKEKDIYYINGSLSLVDGDRCENRTFEAYIFDNDAEPHVYLDITRLCVEDDPKMIRTSESFVEDEKNVMAVTRYAGFDVGEEKQYSAEFPKIDDGEKVTVAKNKQLSSF